MDGCHFREEGRIFQEVGTVGAKILGPRAMVGVSETSVKELQSKASVAAAEGTAEQGQTPRNKLRALG